MVSNTMNSLTETCQRQPWHFLVVCIECILVVFSSENFENVE